jgi:AcrR family transcriptional regulator
MSPRVDDEPVEDPPPAPPGGRRHRAKARMRDRLRANALALFEQHGFEPVSVDDIVAATNVSQRTFFRYFPTKEDVALDSLEEFGAAIRRVLAECPPELTPADALRSTFITIARTDPALWQRQLLVLRLAETSTRMTGALMMRVRGWEGGVAQVLAERDGADADADPRYRLWAAIGFLVNSVNIEWGAEHSPDADPVDSLAAAFDHSAAMFG